MGILLGLATALCWGSADLFARFATRRIGTFRTMLYMQMCGFCLLTLVMRPLGDGDICSTARAGGPGSGVSSLGC